MADAQKQPDPVDAALANFYATPEQDPAAQIGPAIEKALRGYLPTVQKPQAPGPVLSPAERVIAQRTAATQLKSATALPAALTKQLHETAALAAVQPEVSQRMGMTPQRIMQGAADILKGAGRVGMTAVDVAVSQLDRIDNSVRAALSAAQQGHSARAAAKDAFFGYGWRQSPDAYTDFEDILKDMGYKEGQNYGPLLARITAAGATFGMSELLPALGAKEPINFAEWAPNITPRGAAAFAGTMLTAPTTYVGIGPARRAYKLMESGRFLNATGRVAHDTIQKMRFLFDTPEVGRWAANRGVPQMVPALEAATQAAERVLQMEKPTLKAVNEARPIITRAYAMVNEQLDSAIRTGKEQEIPWALRDHVATHTPLSEQSIREIVGTRAQEVTERLLNVEGRRLEDLGGMKFAGITLVPGKPVAAAVRRGAAATKAGLEKVGLGVLPRTAEGIADTIGKIFSTTWRLPGHFARYLQTEYRARLSAAEINIMRRVEDIFRHVDLSDRLDLSKAIDSGTLDALLQERPHLSPVAGRLVDAQNAIFEEELTRGLVGEEDRLSNYIYHFYHDQAKAREYLLSRRPGIKGVRDPSTYQRLIPTLAEAEAAGLKPEYDAQKLLLMRLINGQRAIITHDFLVGAATRFGDLIKPTGALQRAMVREGAPAATVDEAIEAAIAKARGEERESIRKGVKEMGVRAVEDVESQERRIEGAVNEITRNVKRAYGSLKQPLSTQNLIKNGALAHLLADPDAVQPLAQRLVYEGRTDVKMLQGLPEPLRREFMRQRFIKASHEHPAVLEAVKKKYAPLKADWPRGETGDAVADALGLPKPKPRDGPWVTADIPNVGHTHLPERIAAKLKEITDTAIWSEEGKPLQTILRWYNNALLNRARRYVTTPFPAFHFRNAMSNVIQSSLDVGASVLNPRTRMDTIAALRGIEGYRIHLKEGVLSARQIREEFIRQGGWTPFYKRAHITTSNAAEQLSKEMLQDAAPTRFVNPFWWGSTVGTTIENDARMMHYLTLRKDGLAPAQAMERVFQSLYDFTDLTPTERQFFSRFMLFYTWPRKTIPRILSVTARKPRTMLFYQRAVQSLNDESGSPDALLVQRQLMPDYIRNQFGIRIGPRDGEQIIRWFQGMDLPQAEINSLYNGNLERTLEHWEQQFGPLPELMQGLWAVAKEAAGQRGRAEIEEDMGKSYYALQYLRQVPVLGPWLRVEERINTRTGRPVVYVDKKRLQALTGWLALGRVFKEIDRFVSPEDSIYTALGRSLTGGWFLETDPARAEADKLKQAQQQALDLARGQQRQLEDAIIKESVGGPGAALGQVEQ